MFWIWCGSTEWNHPNLYSG